MKKMKKYAGILFMMIISMLACSMTAFAEESPQIKVPVNIDLTGAVPYKSEDFKIVLEAEDASSPMPAGSVDGKYESVITGKGTAYLEITYPKVGIHNYTVHQEPGTHAKGEYDDTVYQMTVYVTNVETGGIGATTILYIDDINTKFDSVDFVNNYKRFGNGGGGGGGNTNKTKITPPDPELENITENDVPLGDGGLLDIIDDMIPLAVLPATGTLWWLAAVLAAAGAVLFLMGFYRNRSYSKDEE